MKLNPLELGVERTSKNLNFISRLIKGRLIITTLTLLILSLLIQSCQEHKNVEELLPAWKSLGLEGKHIKRLRLFEPYLYACAGYDGLWRKDIQSEDSVWEYLGFSNSNLGQSLIYGVMDVIVHPENSDEILVAIFPKKATEHGIFKTDDDGNSWFASDSGLEFHFPEPWDEETYYEHPTIFLQTPEKLFAAGSKVVQSADFGETWEMIGPNAGTVSELKYSFTYHKESTNILWLGGSSVIESPMLLHSVDSGKNWIYVALDSLVGNSNIVYGIALDPNDADIAYVSLFREIIKTTDGGTSWTIIFSLEEHNGQVRSVVEDDSQSGHLFAAVEHNVMETNNGGKTWVDLESPNGSSILSMVFDSEKNILYIGTANASVPSGVFVYR